MYTKLHRYYYVWNFYEDLTTNYACWIDIYGLILFMFSGFFIRFLDFVFFFMTPGNFLSFCGFLLHFCGSLWHFVQRFVVLCVTAFCVGFHFSTCGKKVESPDVFCKFSTWPFSATDVASMHIAHGTKYDPYITWSRACRVWHCDGYLLISTSSFDKFFQSFISTVSSC